MTGYFGKVSTHGDFVSRRLPQDLVQAWDAWLQECMYESQAKLGSTWLERYLNGPLWRFAISPGVLGYEGIGGVMMPSVDRVGRYFPLMVGAVGCPGLMSWFYDHVAWYDTIDELARESLGPTFTVARFDDAPIPMLAHPAMASKGAARRIPSDEEMAAALASFALDSHSLWWTDGGPFVQASMLVCRGMPNTHAFVTMIDESCSPLDSDS
ncbi:type VI secretion system-associated protein TagF [Massilia sp. IC2-476]|uniref:type VI secretion system-associated protein TagF n=1 Tax=Massilia sp. IC2-476 TaxID=2887199 RepID=UPI001D12B068|nr:type VI secretion system-associated protein TagF [Massilia sp. IC2-476]